MEGGAMVEEGLTTPGGRPTAAEQVVKEPEAETESWRARATGRIRGTKAEQMVTEAETGIQMAAVEPERQRTEVLLIGQKNNTQNLLDYNLQLDGCPVTSSTVKNLGVILDSNLSFENPISNVTKTAFFHLRNIVKLRNMLPVSDAEKLVHAFMTSRLDYCNALLGGCPASSINKLQIVQTAAARVLTRSRKYDHITPILQSLHWLPINFRISYKLLLLTYKA